MAKTIIAVFEDRSGWFVEGPERIGPVYSRERAVGLAEGMAFAATLMGHEVELHLEPRSWRREIASISQLTRRPAARD